MTADPRVGPSEYKEIIDALIEFIEKAVVPIEQEHAEFLKDEVNIFDSRGLMTEKYKQINQQVRELSAEAGFYTLYSAESLGGAELPAAAIVEIQEALHHRYGPERSLIHESVIPSPFTNGLSPLLLQLQEDVLAPRIDAIRAGTSTLCFALSEPDAGSDVYNLKTRAIAVDGGWVINGQKQWISNAAHAKHAFVFAVTDPEAVASRSGGITCFFVDTDSAGFSVDAGIPIMGKRGSNATILSFTDLKVTPEQIIGEEGKGLNLAMGGISRGRVTMSATCIGVAQWALDQALEYSKTRKTFGKTIGQHQMIQSKLAEIARDIYLCKSAVQRTAALLDAGFPAIKETSIIKFSCTEMLSRVVDEVMQIHGGLGLTNELGLEGAYRFARTLRIPDGTSEIQRRTVAKRLLAGDTKL
ncbi:acyl-CoA dehydrogenase [Arthrobacter sp. MYb224]|nr:acyl-CoA dehydrogenase [Arthrobacter sp. MYb224]PRA04780.1 acyl-CoA dehydrogenase [Arthrobacter sp. MYb229]PRB52109.1 acyl-CoA dehydrogenase [Arthrobacter sp. MYb216]